MPDVPLTCTNTSEAGGQVIDYVVHSPCLKNIVQVTPITDYPFKPHVVSLRVEVCRPLLPDLARVLAAPDEITETFGPRNFDDCWALHWQQAEAVEPSFDVPWNPAASEAATKLYAKFSHAAEACILATNPQASEKHYGRGAKVEFKTVAVSFENKAAHIYATPAVSFWEKLGVRLRQLEGYMKNGTRSDLIDTTRADIEKLLPDCAQWWPNAHEDTPKELLDLIYPMLQAPSEHLTQRCIAYVNNILTAALKNMQQKTSAQYKDFMLKALEGSAAGGHALLHVFEKDAGKSYETMEDARQQVQGISVQERMVSRINT